MSKKHLTDFADLKVAIVYDRVVKFGGAERILLALKEIWPLAPLYTANYDPDSANWAKNFRVVDSFLKNLPFTKIIPELLPLVTPYAFENFSFSGFDIVISLTSQDAKCIITPPQTLHVCYNLTPTRYLWSGYPEYYRQPSAGIFNPAARFIMKMVFPYLRQWDKISSVRPDYYLAISKTVKKRILKYYGQISHLIYPPVDTDTFVLPEKPVLLNYFLIVSRLVSYKRLDYAIKAFNRLPFKLKIIGSGIDKARLKRMAGKNIEFITGSLTDKKLCWYYQNCLGLIFPGEEDFGLTPLEAQACGRPVIAFKAGGTTETVIDRQTGLFYSRKNEKALTNSVFAFLKHRFNSLTCRNNSLRFSKKSFMVNFTEIINKYYLQYTLRY